MPSTPLSPRPSLDLEVLRPVVYDTLTLLAMLGILGLATLLPGTDRAIPGATLTFRTLVVAVGTVAVVLWGLRAAPAVGDLVESALLGPEAVVADAGRVASALVVFVAVLVAYRGLAGALVPSLARLDIRWTYDVAFLLLALVPLASIANRLHRNLDVVTDLVAAALARRWTGAGNASSPAGDEPTDGT